MTSWELRFDASALFGGGGGGDSSCLPGKRKSGVPGAARSHERKRRDQPSHPGRQTPSECRKTLRKMAERNSSGCVRARRIVHTDLAFEHSGTQRSGAAEKRKSRLRQ